MSDASSHPVAKTLDALSVVSIVGTLMGWLPTAATILSILWFGIQIYESDTFKRFRRWLREKNNTTNRYLALAVVGVLAMIALMFSIKPEIF